MKIKLIGVKPEEMTFQEVLWYHRGVMDERNKKSDKKILKIFEEIVSNLF